MDLYVIPQDVGDCALPSGFFAETIGQCLAKLFDFFSVLAEGDSGLHKAVQKNNRLVIPRVSKDLGFRQFSPKQ